MSDETSKKQQRFVEENVVRLKPIEEDGRANAQVPQKQIKKRASPTLPAIKQSIVPGLAMSNSSIEQAGSVRDSNKTFQETVKRFILRHNSSLSMDSSQSNLPGFNRTKRISLYNYVQSKIDSGLQHPDSAIKKIVNTYPLAPSNPIKWSSLQLYIEEDLSINTQAQQLEFNSGVRYTTLLNALVKSVKKKVKYFLSSTMVSGDERYKIVVNVTVFPKGTVGLCIGSRCLWNKSTDGSITVQMKGVDCNILIVVYLFYTDLGAI